MINAEQPKAVHNAFPGQPMEGRPSEEPFGRSKQCLRQLFDHAAERYLSAAIASEVAEHALQPELTKREWEVLQRMARGASSMEIGAALSIAEGTIKTHVNTRMSLLPKGTTA